MVLQLYNKDMRLSELKRGLAPSMLDHAVSTLIITHVLSRSITDDSMLKTEQQHSIFSILQRGDTLLSGFLAHSPMNSSQSAEHLPLRL